MVETRGGRRFAILIFLAAFLVLLLGRWVSPVDRVAISVSAPFNSAISGVAGWVGDSVSGVFNGPSMRDQIRQLQKQNALLVRNRVDDAALRHQLSIYERMLGIVESQKRLNFVAARVIGHDAN